jgi:hypothetical protein
MENFVISILVDPNNNYEIDKADSVDLRPILECYFPCKACLNTNKSSCTSCFNTIPEWIIHENTCVKQCPGPLLVQEGGKCVKCSSNCASCKDGDSNYCATCSSTLNLLYNGTCYSKCPSGTFKKIGEDIC